MKTSLWAGLEPAQGNPIGFQVQRLNRSAITARFYGAAVEKCGSNMLDSVEEIYKYMI